MTEAVIVSTARSPIGRAGKGSMTEFRPDDLAATIVKAALEKVPALQASRVEPASVLTAESAAVVGPTESRWAFAKSGPRQAEVESVDVRAVWDPVWTQERLSASAREKLAMPLEELIPYREQRIAQEKGA